MYASNSCMKIYSISLRITIFISYPKRCCLFSINLLYFFLFVHVLMRNSLAAIFCQNDHTHIEKKSNIFIKILNSVKQITAKKNLTQNEKWSVLFLIIFIRSDSTRRNANVTSVSLIFLISVGSV